MFFSLFMLFAAQFPAPDADWDALARPWMTTVEVRLFEQLEPRDKIKFRGYFVARRLSELGKWPSSGLYLPEFYAPKTYGDIRDALHFQLGEPKEIVLHPSIRALPLAWRYEGQEFGFKSLGSDQVELDAQARQLWDSVLTQKMAHPELRYDFQASNFGRMRLPDKLEWFQSAAQIWNLPNAGGAASLISVKIPAAFLERFRAEASGNANVERVKAKIPIQQPPSAEQRLELLIFLKANGEKREEVPTQRIRHGSAQVHLGQVEQVFFESQLPDGNYDAEFLIYSGYLEFGIRCSAKLSVLPSELARIGDPILSQSWQLAGLLRPKPGSFRIGDQLYQVARQPEPDQATRVLVQSGSAPAQLQILQADGQTQFLKPSQNTEGWCIFDLEKGPIPARILAWRVEASGQLAALSAWGQAPPSAKLERYSLTSNAQVNYLKLETLELGGVQDWTALFIDQRPYLAGKTGSFPFVPLDWGEHARLSVEPLLAAQHGAQSFELQRTPVYEVFSVKNRYLVVGTRQVDGPPQRADFKILVENQLVPPLKFTAYDKLPKLWGIVVNDALLRSTSWPEMRQALLGWFRKNSADEDLLYLVQISHRPELIVAPTNNKALIQAGMLSLEATSHHENYFTLHYLLEALVHLPEHQTRPHQVLLLTNQLTAETSQMENLIPELRETGLQLYNLEFPFEFKPESAEQIAHLKPDALEEMKEKQRQEDFMRMTTRDNIQEQRNVTTVIKQLTLRWPKPKKKELEKERVREEAFHQAFNTQLAQRTAGLSQVSEEHSSVATIQAFLSDLTRWQETLTHVTLPLPYFDEAMIGIQTPPKYSAGWTIVNWHAPSMP